MLPKIYSESRPVDSLLVSPKVERISVEEAAGLNYKPATIGQQFGPLWATYWFKAKVTVPTEWKGQRVDLQWASHSEAMLWVNGKSVQGLNFEPSNLEGATRPDAILLEKAKGGEMLEFAIEMACNRPFGKATAYHFKSISPFVLDRCDIVRFDPLAWELYYDFSILQELEADHGKELDKSWGGELLSELNRFANEYDIDDRASWPGALKILKALYTRKNATRVHELSAIGHAHIDTAWLWPLAETWRKCDRTFSTQTEYMKQYPEYKFACSQAYQYEIVKARNPDLYRRMKAKVKSGQFIPVGGTWIEPDCNIPSGEALARQFLYGQRFFKQEFGIVCKEFWNPDVFGYNGQLPQIMRQCGITRFLTQKLSWNRFNKPVHHTFTWQGIDGSEVLAHFPPADTYNAVATVAQLRENARNYKDHDRSQHSMMLFGFGDGGGGPTKKMLETLRRARDLQGLPRTEIRTSDQFFDLLEKDCTDRPTMVGELYFEYHRGTYTTQADTKKNNRKNEFLLHDVEFAAVCARRLGGFRYPQAELDRIWKLLLLNQFHDILPGSSIKLVYEDAAKDHADIRKTGESLREAAVKALHAALLKQGTGGAPQPQMDGGTNGLVPVNTLGFRRWEVAEQPGGKLVFIDAPSYGFGRVCNSPDKVSVTKLPNKQIVLENAHLRATLSPDGTVISLVEKAFGREALAGPANVMEIYDDRPTAYDAWDIDPFHLETRKICAAATQCKISETDPLRASVVFERKIGTKSTMKQTVRLSAMSRALDFTTEVEWRESNKMLKAAFPVAVKAMNATYEMQFGAVERPTHYNTTVDFAKYEVPAHKWADLSEHGFGVALLSESKYGFSTYDNTMRISLLRSPKHPDPEADMGKHTFSYALLPHEGGWRDGHQARVVAESFRYNNPVLWSEGPAPVVSLFGVEDANLVLDTVKKAEDGDAIIVRLYEAHGARGSAKLRCALPFKSAVLCDILENESESAPVKDDAIEIQYTPYQVITVKLG